MEKFSSEQRAQLISAAMKLKFDHLLDWTRPTLGFGVGPNDLDVVDAFEAQLATQLSLAKEALNNLPNDQLALLTEEAGEPAGNSKFWWQDFSLAEIRELKRKTPQAIHYGFGHPKFAADMSYWGKMPNYTLHEALLLSLGVEPTSISEDGVCILEKRARSAKLCAAHSYLICRKRMFARFFHHTGWGFTSEGPIRLKKWFDHIELEVHPDFSEALNRRVKHSPSAQIGTSQAESMTSQERNTLLKLVAAMACEQYGFDPTATKGNWVTRIGEDLDLVGLSMDPKTIRKWLGEAAKLVPEAYFSEPS